MGPLDRVRMTNVVEMNACELRNAGELLHCALHPLADLRISRIEEPIIRHKVQGSKHRQLTIANGRKGRGCKNRKSYSPLTFTIDQLTN